MTDALTAFRQLERLKKTSEALLTHAFGPGHTWVFEKPGVTGVFATCGPVRAHVFGTGRINIQVIDPFGERTWVPIYDLREVNRRQEKRMKDWRNGNGQRPLPEVDKRA